MRLIVTISECLNLNRMMDLEPGQETTLDLIPGMIDFHLERE